MDGRPASLEFISIAHPDEATVWRSQVRSHVARAPRAKRSRNPRLAKKAKAMTTQPSEVHPGLPGSGPNSAACIPQGAVHRLRPPGIELLGAASRSLRDDEHFLIQSLIEFGFHRANPPCRPNDNDPAEIGLRRSLTRACLQRAAVDAPVLDATLLLCCQLLTTESPALKDQYDGRAMRYRSLCLRQLVLDLRSDSIPAYELVLYRILVLLCDSALSRDGSTFEVHRRAVVDIIRSRKDDNERNKFIQDLLVWFHYPLYGGYEALQQASFYSA